MGKMSYRMEAVVQHEEIVKIVKMKMYYYYLTSIYYTNRLDSIVEQIYKFKTTKCVFIAAEIFVSVQMM